MADYIHRTHAELMQAETDGAVAYAIGLPIEANPYPAPVPGGYGALIWTAWRQGWSDAAGPLEID